MSNETRTPKWTLTRVNQVDGQNLSLTYQGETNPKLEITGEGKATLNTALRVNGEFTVDGGHATAGAGLTVKDRLAVKGSMSVDNNLTVAGEISGFGAVPRGAILMWSGNVDNLPQGWKLCDGTEYDGLKTPDLSGRFVVSYSKRDGDYNSIKKGEKSVDDKMMTIENKNLPKKIVLVVPENTIVEGTHSEETGKGFGRTEPLTGLKRNKAPKPIDCNIQEAEGKAIDLRPPYYVLAFIMYTGSR